MDVFGIRNRLINDYASYIRSFIHLRDPIISEKVYESLTEGLLWPDPLIQLNPAFEPGEWIEELVAGDVLHPECGKIFRIKPEKSDEGSPLRLHRHQVDAIHAAKSDANYVLTTGTGSGKSLAYIVPIVDRVLRNGKGGGIKAIVVYPMNALCNSQYGELEKFLCHGYPAGQSPVRFAKYTGQESDEQKQEIIADPPDIILTNYVMLELILTRPEENKSLVRAAQGLKYLVLDELHTYRGRQGADVALLVRRVRNACKSEHLQCVGTSATMAGPGSYDDQRQEVARVARKLFGAPVNPEGVIGETLKRSTPEIGLTDPIFLKNLRDRVADPDRHPSADHESFIRDPLSIWIENTFGITSEKESGRLIRSKPRAISGEEGAAGELSKLIDVPEKRCEEAIQEGLLAGYLCKNPDTGFPCFAFRLHQFISRGGNVYASLDESASRYITVHGQQFVPGDRSRVLLPLVFCRECGQEYYCVRSSTHQESNKRLFAGRELPEQLHDEESEAGFLYRNEEKPWSEELQDIIERLPVDWLEETGTGLRIRKDRRQHLPQAVVIDAEGRESEEGQTYHYLKAPFRFCLNCGVSYDMRQRSDIGKLASLGTEGRSSATTILSLSAIRHLKKEETLDLKSRKLLSFTDNRQDASLQSALRWVAGDGTKPFHDAIRMPSASEAGGRTNRFFLEFYRDISYEGKGLEAREHTAQVDNETRQQREAAFKEGKLPVLYCSPTMELGVDIATLNAVNMRNVPPTPANYAQRSGRAGRSGQPALVFTYCTTGSPHDQYFFKRPELMVAGAVVPPRLELANEDLVRAHVHAVWLAETGQSLGKSLKDILNLTGESPPLELQPHVHDSLEDEKAKARALTRARDILSTISDDLKEADWYSEGWLGEVFKKIHLNFEQACERWRGLYRAALKQREIQNRIIGDASRNPSDKVEAKRLRREAEAQLDLLIESDKIMQSDFYSYRYFASEGFLPGYNFPRLPLSAYIPGRRERQDHFLSRPRFLAISEFGPRNIIYHEGSRYVINRVIMPVGDDDVKTASAKLCPQCGYLHDIWGDTAGADLCEYCNTILEKPLEQLFRIQNVSTKRKDRINCDEEERQRQGYEIKTGVRFADHDGRKETPSSGKAWKTSVTR